MLIFLSSNWRWRGVSLGYQFLIRLVRFTLGWWSLFTCKPRNWFSSCSISLSDSKEVWLELLAEQVPNSFLTKSYNFWFTISKVVLSLDLRLACILTGNFTKGFSKDWIGLTRLLDWGITLFSTLSSDKMGFCPFWTN